MPTPKDAEAASASLLPFHPIIIWDPIWMDYQVAEGEGEQDTKQQLMAVRLETFAAVHQNIAEIHQNIAQGAVKMAALLSGDEGG